MCGSLQAAKPEPYVLPQTVRSPFTLRGLVYRAASSAWERGVTPGTIIRSVGPLSRRFTQNYTRRRMRTVEDMPQAEMAALEPYIHGCLAGRGSGEVRRMPAVAAFPSPF